MAVYMRFSKETLYHFTCEKCDLWWSIAVENMKQSYRTWYCPWCAHAHEPPHYIKHDKLDPPISQYEKDNAI